MLLFFCGGKFQAPARFTCGNQLSLSDLSPSVGPGWIIFPASERMLATT